MMGGLDRPTCGTILVKENDLNEMKEDAPAVFRRRKIGFMNLANVLSFVLSRNLKREFLVERIRYQG